METLKIVNKVLLGPIPNFLNVNELLSKNNTGFTIENINKILINNNIDNFPF